MSRIVAICSLFMLGLSWAGPATGSDSAGATEYLPRVELTVPADDSSRDYLGLTAKSGESFTPADIKADILLIELFSMYCPFCQNAAPSVNRLFQEMEEVSKNGPVVKIIGIGAANSQFEVEHFKETYDISFPLFPDRDRSIYIALAGAGTPTFIGCRLNNGKKAVIVLRKAGAFDHSDEFLQEMIKRAGF